MSLTESLSHDELSLVDPNNVPKHVAVLMDGNRRWARKRDLPDAMGHWEGADVLTEIVRAASELGIKTMTMYVFSTENWQRSEDEVEALMNILEFNLVRKRQQMVDEGVRLSSIGNLSRLPASVQNALDETKKATAHCTRINLVLAINYGGRDEIRRAVAKIIEQKISPEQVTEELIAKHLDTAPFGDPDLVIRPSGEYRLSNFLLWQVSYAEIYVTQTLWPDFTPKNLLEAVIDFQSRKRRRGAC